MSSVIEEFERWDEDVLGYEHPNRREKRRAKEAAVGQALAIGPEPRGGVMQGPASASAERRKKLRRMSSVLARAYGEPTLARVGLVGG